ncbi:MAG: glycosyltransferase family 39 protein [Bacteroidales bacterium]|nr:glycosyltransferase family 39 protein [Bacteroidales bacterium]
MNKYLVIKNFKIKYTTLFLIVFIVMALYYSYGKILFMRPAGIHQWRNCICATYARNYYYGANFFKPETSCYVADNFTSDVVVLEFPIFYYLVSLLYRIFGFQEFLYRLANVIVGFLGLLSLFKLTRKVLNDNFFAFIVPFFIFSSTVYTFYLNNFIIDPTALSLSLIGLYLFYQYSTEKKIKHFYFAMLMFMIGGLMKPTSMLVFLSIIALFGFEFLFKIKIDRNQKIFDKPLIQIVGFFVVIASIISWYYYSKKFGEIHGVIQPVSTRSIWTLPREQIHHIWNEFTARFKVGYFYGPIFVYFTGIVLLFNIVFYKRFNRLLNLFTFLTFAQVLAFNLLFFQSIGRCDYYQINNLVFIAILYLNLIFYLKSNHSRIFHNLYFRIAVVIGILFLIHDCKLGMNRKYSDWHYNASNTNFLQKYGQITPYLRQLGIQRDDRVYVSSDGSMNISLYLMDQKGNNETSIGPMTKGSIDFLKSKGTKYLIISDPAVYKEDLGPYISNKIGHFSGVDIYKLD